MSPDVSIGLYALVIWSAGSAGMRRLRRPSQHLRATPSVGFPMCTVAALLAITVPSVLQLWHPWLLADLERNSMLLVNGEWWRAVTPLFVQDSGVPGMAFNLSALAVIGVLAERLLGRREWIAVFLASWLGGELVGSVLWPSIGAGNSITNFGLLGAVLVSNVLAPEGDTRVISLVGLAGVVLLLALQDLHGPAAMIGGVVALCFKGDCRQGQSPARRGPKGAPEL